MFGRRKKSRPEGMDVTKVVYYVKKAIVEAEKRQLLARADTETAEKKIPSPFAHTIQSLKPSELELEIESLKLTLKTFVETEVSGSCKLKVPFTDFEFGGGGGVKEQDIQTIIIALKPPKVEPSSDFFSSEEERFEKSLVDAITTIQTGVKAAAQAPGEPEFTFDSATVELNFGVAVTGEIEVAAKGSRSKETTHGLELTLHKKTS